MRSRAVRLTFGAVAWIALGAAAFFLIQSERQIAQMQTAVRAFDVHAREATDALSDLRAAQQAYVAAGQGVAFWMPKVAATVDTVATTVAALGRSATSVDARSALDNASLTVAEFIVVDNRARDYIKNEQQLMAADVVFTEGGETAVTAARHVEIGRIAEHQAADASEAALRQQEALALTAPAALAAVVIALLLAGRPLQARPPAAVASGSGGFLADAAQSTDPPVSDSDELVLRASPAQARQLVPAPSSALSPRPARALSAAAEPCTDFGRVGNIDQVHALLARAADLMDASGLVVWLGDAVGGDMRPVLTHGYGPQAIARMPAVSRSANNAAAAAYRAGQFQIVLARPGSSSGAIVAPLLSSVGCIGALCAEIRSGGETSDSVQALAAIFAAQLAGVFATTSASLDSKSAVQG